MKSKPLFLESEQSLIDFLNAKIDELITLRLSQSSVDIVSRDELAKRLGVTSRHIINLERKGFIRSIKVGSSIRYDFIQVVKSLQ